MDDTLKTRTLNVIRQAVRDARSADSLAEATDVLLQLAGEPLVIAEAPAGDALATSIEPPAPAPELTEG